MFGPGKLSGDNLDHENVHCFGFGSKRLKHDTSGLCAYFTRLRSVRSGRSWVAIREQSEPACTLR